MVESRHRGWCVVADAQGRLVAALGDPDVLVYPRSSIKPLQALALIESGAADRFAASAEEIALACASHDGSPEHTTRVLAWLKRMGLSEADLACGAHVPTDANAAAELIRQSRAPSAVHNNCSGKHAGILASAAHLGEPTRGYLDPDHPAERRLKNILVEMGGADLVQAPSGTDGCGIPVFAMPLAALARAMARLASPESLAPLRGEAARRVIVAMTRHPRLVSGVGRFDSEAMAQGAGAFIVKGGAEGMHAAAIPALGLGIALKIEDGAGRASHVAMAELLARFARIDLVEWRAVILRNVAGRAIGTLCAADALRA
jgi:L-asparaginase II